MKKKILSVSTVILLLAFASSCSQDVEYACAEQERTEESSFQCIEGLTRDLRALNARYRAQDTAAQRAPKVTYTKGDMVKIAIADVKGALRGTGGGPGGMVVLSSSGSSPLVEFKIEEGVKECSLATPNLNAGIYQVTLVENGIATETYKFIK